MGKILRRTFLLGLGAVAGGLAVGYYAYRKPHPNPLQAGLANGEASFSPWLKFGADGTVTVYHGRAEMGQGVSTTLAALVAEELDYPLDAITVEHGPASAAYYNAAMLEEGGPFPVFADGFVAETMRDVSGSLSKMLGLQVTGGSSSVRDAFDKMRIAGASAKAVILQAAAAQADADVGTMTWTPGAVIGPDGTSYEIADLLGVAARLTPPQSPRLKDPADWTLLGKPQKRTDMVAKVTGAPIFGIDVSLDDMVHGTVRMAPRFGSKILRADTSVAEAMPGVIRIIRLETQTGDGFGVIASNTWAAFKAAQAIDVEWLDADYPPDTEGLLSVMREAAAGGVSGSALRDDGDVTVAFADAPNEDVIDVTYEVPFLAHATMEPMNATAQFADGRLTLWSPNQAPTVVRQICASVAGIAEEAVTVNTTHLGGGFGRRGEVDFNIYATLLAMQANGRPVKVVWTREEDMTHDTYRPAAVARSRAISGPDGVPMAIDMRIATPSILKSVMGRTFPGLSPVGPERLLTEGAFDQPYFVPDYRVTGIDTPNKIPVGFWRSVGNSFNGFFHECLLDELALKMDQDPIAMRIAMMADHPTAIGVMEKLAELADWATEPGANRARGVAFTLSFGSWVGQVVEVANTADGIRIERVAIVADVGRVLDPSITEAQLVSGAIFGMSSVINQAITFADGMVEQQNFYDYDAIRMRQCPRFDVAILENAPKMGGVGEIGTPPSIPALVNAVSRLTGTRHRRLPLSGDVTFA